MSTLADCLILQYTYGCSGELQCPVPRIHNSGLEKVLVMTISESSVEITLNSSRIAGVSPGYPSFIFMAKTNAIISSGTIPGGTAVF